MPKTKSAFLVLRVVLPYHPRIVLIFPKSCIFQQFISLQPFILCFRYILHPLITPCVCQFNRVRPCLPPLPPFLLSIRLPTNSVSRICATNLAGVDPLAGECVVVGPHFDCTVSLVVEDDFNVVVTNSTDVVGEAQDRTLDGQTLFRE